jgi:hypothetical protein
LQLASIHWAIVESLEIIINVVDKVVDTTDFHTGGVQLL